MTIQKFGNNQVKVVVTSENGKEKTYTLNVYREAPASLLLRELTVTNNETNYELSPNFDRLTMEYTVKVDSNGSQVTVNAKAEEEKELCQKVNVLGTKNITEASIAVNAKIIYISTDYVFNGQKKGIYYPDDDVNPQNIYGKTKYLGEEETRRNPKHYIARISWVFGINNHNFVKTMLKLADTHSSLNVVDDQVGSPTYTVDLAKILVDMADTNKYGTYHITNEGFCSWADFTEEILGVDIVVPDATELYFPYLVPELVLLYVRIL